MADPPTNYKFAFDPEMPVHERHPVLVHLGIVVVLSDTQVTHGYAGASDGWHVIAKIIEGGLVAALVVVHLR